MRARDVKCETSGPLSYFLPPYSGLLAQAQPIFKFSYRPVKFQDYILHSGDLSTPGKILASVLVPLQEKSSPETHFAVMTQTTLKKTLPADAVRDGN